MNEHEPQPPPSPVRKTPAVLLATGLGVGFVRVMPGTVGTLWGIPLVVLMSWLPVVDPLPWFTLRLLMIIGLGAVGVPLCTAAARQFGRKDPGSIVWDEIAALPIVFLLLPSEQMRSPLTLLLGFLCFRLTDISKPPPINRLEKLPDGLGVMADDWLAALYACPLLHLALFLLPPTWVGG